jgi:hypothetical protein
MSNCATITSTMFTDIHNGNVSYGFRISDDYGASYGLTPTCVKNDVEILGQVLLCMCDSVIAGIIDCIIEDEFGMTINGNFYEYAEIKDIIDAAMA